MPKPVDTQALDWKLWLGGAPDQPFSEEKFYRWRWYWNFGGGGMTDLFTHWIDVAHWAMKSDTPHRAQMLGDKYIFEEWDCPDTLQAALRYPGWDVVYEGMMSSSIDDGGLEFRGTEATLKIDRSGFGIYREGVKTGQNPILNEDSFRDGTIDHMENFFACVKTPQGTECARRNRNRRRARRPHRQSRLQAHRADYLAAQEFGIRKGGSPTLSRIWQQALLHQHGRPAVPGGLLVGVRPTE